MLGIGDADLHRVSNSGDDRLIGRGDAEYVWHAVISQATLTRPRAKRTPGAHAAPDAASER